MSSSRIYRHSMQLVNSVQMQRTILLIKDLCGDERLELKEGYGIEVEI